MITKEEIQLLKEKYIKEVEYYEFLGFSILQGKFQEFVNILIEIENMMETRDSGQDITEQTEDALIDDARNHKEEI